MTHWTIVVALAFACLGQAAAHEPQIQLLNPTGLFQPTTFSQLAVVSTGKLVLVSGQTARDAQSKLVGKADLRAQTIQVFENLKIALESVGAGFHDVAKLTTFVVGLKPNDRT